MSDASGVLASPRVVLERGRDRAADHRAIAALVDEVGAERVVVGLPLSLDGGEGPAATLVRQELGELAAALAVPVEAHDERFSTVSADRALIAAGLKAPSRRKVVDRVAAAVLLQSWLDGPGKKLPGHYESGTRESTARKTPRSFLPGSEGRARAGEKR